MDTGLRGRGSRLPAITEVFTTMRGRKNPPLDLTPAPDGAPVTFDTMAIAYLQDYQLQRYRSLTTARARVEHLRGFFSGAAADTMTADRVRSYQLYRRKQGFEAATINRETSALSRMFHLAIRRGQLERMPLFPKRLEENPPRDGFFEHDEYMKVRTHLPRSYQDVLDFAYYSGWRRNEILGLTWDEIDLNGGVIRLTPRRSKTRTGRVLPISPPLQTVLKRRLRRRQATDPRVFRRDGVPVRDWRHALRDACRKAKVPHRLLHDCRRTAARNLIRAEDEQHCSDPLGQPALFEIEEGVLEPGARNRRSRKRSPRSRRMSS